MANLPFLDKNKLEKLFNMKTGYVLNFTNRKFREFVFDSTRKNIYDEPTLQSPAEAMVISGVAHR